MSDQQQLRGELTGILSEYEEVQPDNAVHNNSIGFWLYGKRWLFTYPAQDIPGALHQRLRELGAKPKRQAIPKPPPRVRPVEKPVENVDKPSVQPKPEPSEPPAATSDKPATPTMPVASLARVFNRDHGYSIFQSHRVIAIEVDRELVIPKGNVLVVPLHRAKTLIDMPSDQFHVLFDEAQEIVTAPDEEPLYEQPTPVAEQVELDPSVADQPVTDEPIADEPIATDEEVVAEVEQTPPPRRVEPVPLPEGAHDVLRYLRGRKGAVRSKVIATGVGFTIKHTAILLRRLLEAGEVVSPTSGFFDVASRPTVRRPLTPIVDEPIEPPTPVKEDRVYQAPMTSTRSREGVGAQMGRILIAMSYASKVTGKSDLTTVMVTPHLSERDSRQYGARLPEAMKNGFIERGIPLQGTRGWHYKITQKGRELAKKLGEWPFRQDHEEIPTWLPHLFAA